VEPASPPDTLTSADESWGIYQLDLDTEKVNLIYGAQNEISGLSLDPTGINLVFSQMTDGNSLDHTEIYKYSLIDQVLARLTDNSAWDVYPVWSPEGSQIAFLSLRESTLDIYIMDANGDNQRLLYDSGFHDADIDWIGKQIAFTSQSIIWIMDSDGKNPRPLTDPPRAGEWGQANLPFGDYDPRLSPDGSKVLFSRMIEDASPHGNYDLFLIGVDGLDPVNLTKTGYTQGLSSWSPSGAEILFIISAIEGRGVFDLYTITQDGSEVTLKTPAYFPPDFLIQGARYGSEDSTVYFVGQWWEDTPSK
jgi:TolB protein